MSSRRGSARSSAQQKELKAKEEKLQRDGAVMAENERRNAEKDLREGQRELARKQNEYVEDLNLRRNEELGKLQRSLLQEVQAFARTSSYDLVVGDGVLYVNESMDITPQVLSALQARAKTGGRRSLPRRPRSPRRRRPSPDRRLSRQRPFRASATEPVDAMTRSRREPGRTRRPLRLHAQGRSRRCACRTSQRSRRPTPRRSRSSPIRAIAASCADAAPARSCSSPSSPRSARCRRCWRRIRTRRTRASPPCCIRRRASAARAFIRRAVVDPIRDDRSQRVDRRARRHRRAHAGSARAP